MSEPKSANGVTGVLLPIGRTWVFRVYHDDGEFTDYDIFHSDLQAVSYTHLTLPTIYSV